MKRIVALMLSLVMFLTQPFSCALAAINLPANLKSIQTEAFAGVPMTYIVVDNAETELADGALEDTRKIEGIGKPREVCHVLDRVKTPFKERYGVFDAQGAQIGRKADTHTDFECV